MGDKIISKPGNQKYRDHYDEIFGTMRQVDEMFKKIRNKEIEIKPKKVENEGA